MIAAPTFAGWTYATGGYIGLWFMNAGNAVLDDFGGGTVFAGEGMAGMSQGLEAIEISFDPFNMEITDADTFWQGVPLESKQEATVTFTHMDAATRKQKPQGNGTEGEGTIQILYDLKNQRILVWRYELQTGWAQMGKDIPVTFTDGDVFTARALTKDTVEIRQNGKRLAEQRVGAGLSVVSVPVPVASHGIFQPVSYNLPPHPALFKPALQTGSVTITYDYDSLYRLTEANYSNGDFYHYTYDAVGNRKTQTTSIGGMVSTTMYNYDHANRIIDVDGVLYDYDANGNLLNDGVNAYTYDSANRLKTLTNASVAASYTYNGLNDRLQETVNGQTTTFTMDLNTGLTQALSDGTHAYIYGNGRIAQVNTTTEYFLGDALGSVRQLTNASGQVTLAKAYTPYGEVMSSSGSGTSMYAFTGEQTDVSGLTYLRSRYYSGNTGRFISRDTWGGDANRPMSYNRWSYTEANPINNSDPSGLCKQYNWNDPSGELFSKENCDMLENIYLDATNKYSSTKNLWKMVEWYDKLADAAEKDGNVQSATNIRHFLHGNGAPLRLSDDFMRSQLWGWDYIQNSVNQLVKWKIQKDCDLTSIADSGYARAIVIFPGGLFGNLRTKLLNPPSDVAGALGNFRLDAVISGNLQKSNNLFNSKISANLNVHLVALDYYYWKEDNNATVMVQGKIHGVPDDWGYILARFGPARNYFVRGDLDVNINTVASVPWFGVGEAPPDPWYASSCIGIKSIDDPANAYPKGTCAPDVP